ncbi:hypothetical protein [Polluticoccus soli]|uniref:hypothetical protein n=1 Tax=Polluticoccus soli TaxID=3034150 RepID=UPI0023E24915|nr:hypothetical protein [Flavipsychrobacter sp. JY13-12]
MQVFHLIFSRNKIISCTQVSTPPEFNGNVRTKTAGNILVSAYIRARSEEKAIEIGKELLGTFASA